MNYLNVMITLYIFVTSKNSNDHLIYTLSLILNDFANIDYNLLLYLYLVRNTNGNKILLTFVQPLRAFNCWKRLHNCLQRDIKSKVAFTLLMQIYLQGAIHAGIPAIIFGIVATIAGLLSLMLPETLNRKMPESVAEVERSAKKK